jgi:hypothetical protein
MNNHERAELDWFGQAREGPGGSHVGTIGIWVVKTYLGGGIILFATLQATFSG